MQMNVAKTQPERFMESTAELASDKLRIAPEANVEDVEQ